MKEYRNPILSGFNPDPSICRLGEDYYLSTSSFWYCPMLPIYHSRDLINWTLVNHAVNSEKQDYRIEEKCRNGIFAPTIRHNEFLNKFFIVSCFNDQPDPSRRSFLISADSPEKEWSAPLFLKPECCDPSLFFDIDNRAYIQYVTDAQDKIFQYEIDIDTGKALSLPVAIWEGTGGRRLEAPHVYFIDDYYYLIAAEGGTETGHYISLARSEHLNGPYVNCPHNPILTHRDRKAEFSPIQCVGHGDLVQAPDGKWWIVCLGVRALGPTKKESIPLGRETFLAPVEWNGDAWPVVKNPGFPDGTLSLRTFPEREMAPLLEKNSWKDDFDTETLDIDWYFLRTPQKKSWNLSERAGWLKISGTPIRLGDWSSPALICKRQKHFKFKSALKMNFQPLHENDEAGLAVFSSDERSYEIGIRRHNGENIVFFRKRILDICEERKITNWNFPEIILELEGDFEKYSFRYGSSDKDLSLAGSGSVLLMTHPWTGNHFGLYAVSEKRTPAYFDWMDCKVLQGNE